MDIEVADIRKISGDGNLRAFADLKFGEAVMVKGFSVMNGRRGLFVSMPRKAGKDGRWFEIVSPLSEEIRQQIESLVMEAFERETDGVTA